jgi:effector-binding domain-containing protein
MRSELERAERIVAELSRTTPAEETPARLVTLPRQTAVALSAHVSGAEFSSFLEQAYAAVLARVDQLGLRVAGSPGALYPAEILDDTGEPTTAFVPVEAAPANVGDGLLRLELPSLRAAVLTHRGGYDALGDSYAALGAWVAHHARPTGAPVREIYTVGPDAVPDPSAYRTDICWPVELDEPTNHSQQEGN